LGLWSATLLVVANMVGTGIFTTSGFIIQELGHPLALLACWGVGGLYALAGALCYGELGARYPRAGGEYVFLRESFGEAAAFLSGWISLLVGFSAPIAAAAMAFAAYCLAAAGGGFPPGLQVTWRGLTLLNLSPATLLAGAAILALSLLHCHSLLWGSRVQNLLTLFKIALIVAFVLGGLGWGRGDWAHIAVAPTADLWLPGRFAVSLVLVSFAYSGWNAAAYLGGEISRPARNIPLALASGTLLVTLLYLLLNLTFLYALAPGDMAGVLEVGERAALALFGPGISHLLAGAVALSLLSLISAMIMTGPRVYLAMAQDGLFFAGLGRRGSRGTPGNAILLQAGLALLLVLTASFDYLLLFIGVTLSLFSLLTVAGLLLLRRRDPRPDLPYRTVGYPLTPLFFILLTLWIAGFSLHARPVLSLAGLAALASGLVLYLFFSRRRRCQGAPATGGHEPT
jgi:APA family basic amino acid/polyamine antiporter